MFLYTTCVIEALPTGIDVSFAYQLDEMVDGIAADTSHGFGRIIATSYLKRQGRVWLKTFVGAMDVTSGSLR